MASYHNPATRLIFLGVIVILLSSPSYWSHASNYKGEKTIVTVTLNTVKKGDFIVFLTEDRDILIKEQDLLDLGVKNFTGERQLIDDSVYIRLRSVPGLKFVFDEDSLTLEIDVLPEIMGKTKSIDLAHPTRKLVYFHQGMSAFLNYTLSWNDSLGSRGFVESSTELGVRHTNYLFLSNFIYRDLPIKERFVRLSSQLTWENKENLWSVTLGDTYSSSGMLGSTVSLGGVSFLKNYTLNPYYVKAPTFDYSGYVTLPTEMWLYVNDIPIRQEKLEPGQYDLKNVPLLSGLNNMKIVLKDAYGRETVIAESAYYTDTLLKKGEHEFNYHAGALRKNQGMESNRYGPGIFLFSHRYGVSDRLTVGLRGEGSRDLINGGLVSSFCPFHFGTTEMNFSLSRDEQKNGFSLYAAHSFTSDRINFGISGKGNTKDYSTLTGTSLSRYETHVSIGLRGFTSDTITANFNRQWYFDSTESSRVTFTYTKSLTKNLYLTCSASRLFAQRNDTLLFLNLIYFPWKESNLSGSFSRDRYSTMGSITLQKNPTVKKEDYSYRVSVNTSHFTEGENKRTLNTFNPFVQINRGYGQYVAEYTGTFKDARREQESYRLAFSGALVYADGHGSLSIPVYDSFAIVKVGEIKDVVVKMNHQEAGKTNAKGLATIPYLRSNVDNLISIDDRQVPLNYAIKTVSKLVNPSTRQGIFLPFEVVKTQAFTGKIRIREKNISIPLENVIIKIKLGDRTEVFPVLSDGEFYFENVPPGNYEAEFTYKNRPARFSLRIPESDKFLVNMGVIELEMD